MGEVRILGRVTSINVRKVRWAADLMGIGYTTEVWGLPDRDPKVPEFLALNPNGQVPVMIEDGFVLWESNAVMRYFAETRQSPLLPTAPQDRALVDQWLTWQATELNPAWVYSVMALLRKNPAYGDAERIEESIKRWTRMMEILEAQLQRSGTFVVGSALSLADIALALSTHRWMSMPIDRPPFPATEAHYDRLKATPEGADYFGAGIV